MPLTTSVTADPAGQHRTAGGYLTAAAAGQAEPAEVAFVAVGESGEIAADAELDAMLGIDAAQAVAAHQLSGKPGQAATVLATAGDAVVRVVFMGVGDRSPLSLRRAGAESGRLLKPGDRAVAAVVAGAADDQVRAFTEGLLLGTYRYTQKSADGDGEPASVRLLASPGPVSEAAAFAAAVALARDLTNTPSVRKSPQWLADAAVQAAADSGLTVRIWTEDELADAGFGGIVAVGAGSARPPRLIELGYAPPSASRHVVLIGKGITFDSGGLSLKPNDGMKNMKTDMAGGAAVIAAMAAMATLGIPHRVTGLVAAAENMPSGSAYRPGDIISHYGGRTVEVLNTDAEGRLVLADALAYADAVLDPDEIVDLATLTGAARVALGSIYGAVYSTSDQLADALVEAGEASGDRLWRMPLFDDYRALLDSPVADVAHIDRGAGQAGSIAAALFLREFAGGRRWAHLDIAGAARAAGDDGERTAGATGFGTRLLLRWLSQLA
jgi:leucyl aminopeptidase